MEIKSVLVGTTKNGAVAVVQVCFRMGFVGGGFEWTPSLALLCSALATANIWMHGKYLNWTVVAEFSLVFSVCAISLSAAKDLANRRLSLRDFS